MTCKDDVDNWMSTLAISSKLNIKYNMESGGRSRTGKWVSFTRWYIIMPVQTKKADQKKKNKRLLKKQNTRQKTVTKTGSSNEHCA